MHAFMCFQMTPLPEWFITYVTGKWMLPTMYQLMCLQITMPPKWFITHITGKWLLPTVYEMVSLQIVMPSEWFITHITGIWTLAIRYILEFFWSSLLKCKRKNISIPINKKIQWVWKQDVNDVNTGFITRNVFFNK
jgi:hypothetical protein